MRVVERNNYNIVTVFCSVYFSNWVVTIMSRFDHPSFLITDVPKVHVSPAYRDSASTAVWTVGLAAARFSGCSDTWHHLTNIKAWLWSCVAIPPDLPPFHAGSVTVQCSGRYRSRHCICSLGIMLPFERFRVGTGLPAHTTGDLNKSRSSSLRLIENCSFTSSF